MSQQYSTTHTHTQNSQRPRGTPDSHSICKEAVVVNLKSQHEIWSHLGGATGMSVNDDLDSRKEAQHNGQRHSLTSSP